MTDRPIGYYVHHHGAGHLERARAIAGVHREVFVLMGTGIGSLGIDLPDDRLIPRAFDGKDGATCRPEALHYAPLDQAGIRSRVAMISRWIDASKPALMVVDVSVEVAMLARLASVPVVYVRLNGDRTDVAHLDAFRGAVALLAPFHQDLDAPATPQWVRAKTRYLPGITAQSSSGPGEQTDIILVVVGRGGPPAQGNVIAQAAASSPQWRWRVMGPCSRPDRCPTNLEILGWVEAPDREIGDAAVVVGGAGDGLVSRVLAADRPFICLPERRPYGEQDATAARLAACVAAVTLSAWPEPHRWPDLIDQACSLPPWARRKLHDADGARAAAQWLREIAKTRQEAPECAA